MIEEQKPSLRKTRVSCRFIGGFQDTRTNEEDFAFTPYLFGVCVTGAIIKVRGLGICWGYYSVYLALGWKIPKNYPSFMVMSKNGNSCVFTQLRIIKLIN